MSKRGEWIGDASFAGGEQSDQPPHLIAEDGLLKADNVVLSKTGRLSKRGPVQPYLLTAKNDTLFQLAQYQLNNYNAPYRGFGLGQESGGAQRWYTFSLVNPPTTDRAGVLNTGQAFSGSNANQNNTFNYDYPRGPTPPSFNYLGIPFFPSGEVSGTTDAFFAFAGKNSWAGQPNVTPTTASVTVTAGDAGISIPTTLMPSGQASDYPGNFIYIYNPSATPTNRNLYIGIIISAAAGPPVTVTVFPTPQVSFTGNCYVGVTPYASGPYLSTKAVASTLYAAGAFPPTTEPVSIPSRVIASCAHQNRIVCAPEQLTKLPNLTYSVLPVPTRTEKAVITWSAIAGEPATASSSKADGILPLQIGGWPANQSITLETAGIVSLVSMDANNLLVLCSDRSYLLSGTLGTILPAANVNTSSFNVRTVSQKVGCISNLTVQRTPLGVMFASRDGVYITDGASFTNVMEGKIQQKWNLYVDNILDLSVPITGSALIGETHYVLFTQSGNFICDLYNNFSWTTMSVGPAYSGLADKVSYGYGIQDWRGRSEVYAPKVTSNYDSTSYCDKIVLVDSILLTDGSIKTDVPYDGAITNGEFAYSVDAGSAYPMNAEVWTRAYTFGDPSTLKAYKTMTATYLADAKVNGTDPVNVYFAEGLEPTVSYVTSYATVDSSPSGDTSAMRVSLIPRVIDNGVSFGFKTNFERSDSPAVGLFSSLCRFAIYELALNFVGLRKGRTKQ